MGKVVAILFGGIVALYIVGWLLAVPVSVLSRGFGKAAALNMHAVLYAPLRDALPTGNPVRVVLMAYQNYWCSQGGGCEVAGSSGGSVKKTYR